MEWVMKRESGRRDESESEWQVKREIFANQCEKYLAGKSISNTASSHTQKQEWMCSHSSKTGREAKWNWTAERLMNIMFKYRKTIMQFSLLSFTLKCPLVTSTFPLRFRWIHMEFLLERCVPFPSARYISSCWELNLSLKWKLCKWKCCLWQLKLSACAI